MSKKSHKNDEDREFFLIFWTFGAILSIIASGMGLYIYVKCNIIAYELFGLLVYLVFTARYIKFTRSIFGMDKDYAKRLSSIMAVLIAIMKIGCLVLALNSAITILVILKILMMAWIISSTFHLNRFCLRDSEFKLSLGRVAFMEEWVYCVISDIFHRFVR